MIADHVQDRPEHLLFEEARRGDLGQHRAEEHPAFEPWPRQGPVQHLGLATQPLQMSLQRRACVFIDHRTDIGHRIGRVAQHQGVHGA